MVAHLFESFTMGNLELKNRFIRSATWDATADNTGKVTAKSLEIYRKLGGGNLGLIVTGFTFVSLSGQAGYNQYGIHSDEMIPGLRSMVKAAKINGSKIAVQIMHSGINSIYLAGKNMESLAMSRMKNVSRPHREMTEEDIENIIHDFATAAVRARAAGFDAVQLHGAHAYLISQAASPLFNQRTDCWGGSPENRRRLHLEIIRAIRQAVGRDYPLFIKFGVMDDKEGGLTLEEGLETARQMVAAGIDAIEVSAGVGQASIIIRAGEPEVIPFRERAARLKQEVSVPIILVNGIRNLETANEIVHSGDADMISLSRPLIREPGLLNRWQSGEQVSAKCISCSRCLRIREGEFLKCHQEPIFP